jgi:hypothetical protein
MALELLALAFCLGLGSRTLLKVQIGRIQMFFLFVLYVPALIQVMVFYALFFSMAFLGFVL